MRSEVVVIHVCITVAKIAFYTAFYNAYSHIFQPHLTRFIVFRPFIETNEKRSIKMKTAFHGMFALSDFVTAVVVAFFRCLD